MDFFEQRGHKILPSSSLVPAEIDPSILFTTAGMHPLVPYLLGEKHPLGMRLCDIQKCLRTVDIEEVGDSQHLTFFEMLGYWSLGDYFKLESIKYTFGFYTEVLGFDKDNISVTVFEGDENVPFDQESYRAWKDVIGIPEERIFKYPRSENWWGPVGETGPCGPDTEMFIDTGIEKCSKKCGPSCNCDKFVEIGNNVFMEFNRTQDGKYVPLKQKNVDVGLGFERLVMFSQKKSDVFQTDIFAAMIKEIEKLSDLKYGDKSDVDYVNDGMKCWVDVRKQMRIIVDHIRAATFAIGDGALPSNKGAGYIVRRLIRRAVVQAMQFPDNKGIARNFTCEIAKIIFPLFPDYKFDENLILAELDKEESKFRKTLKEGIKIIESRNDFSTKDIFDLFQSYGIPAEISTEEIHNRGKTINHSATVQDQLKLDDEIAILFKEHQDLSRTASAGMFKGGLADSSEETTKLHTAAHLLLASLRKVLGDHVVQKGSNITAERLRFDFSHPEKLTPEQIAEVEKLVNEAIDKKTAVTMEEMSIAEAKNCGAHGTFDERYGDKVKVYTIADGGNIISREICGGPHAANTSELGKIKIKKEESSSAGVRRIKAILEV